MIILYAELHLVCGWGQLRTVHHKKAHMSHTSKRPWRCLKPRCASHDGVMCCRAQKHGKTFIFIGAALWAGWPGGGLHPEGHRGVERKGTQELPACQRTRGWMRSTEREREGHKGLLWAHVPREWNLLRTKKVAFCFLCFASSLGSLSQAHFIAGSLSGCWGRTAPWDVDTCWATPSSCTPCIAKGKSSPAILTFVWVWSVSPSVG